MAVCIVLPPAHSLLLCWHWTVGISSEVSRYFLGFIACSSHGRTSRSRVSKWFDSFEDLDVLLPSDCWKSRLVTIAANSEAPVEGPGHDVATGVRERGDGGLGSRWAEQVLAAAPFWREVAPVPVEFVCLALSFTIIDASNEHLCISRGFWIFLIEMSNFPRLGGVYFNNYGSKGIILKKTDNSFICDPCILT